MSLLGRVQVLSSVVRHTNGRFLSVLCIFVRCKEEEESVSLLGRVQVLSSVVRHTNGRFLSVLCTVYFCQMQGGGGECESTGTGPGAEQCGQTC